MKQAFKWVQKIPKPIREDMHVRIAKGESLPSVADFLQDAGLFKHLKRNSVVRNLMRYRQVHMDDFAIINDDVADVEEKRVVLHKLDGQCDELREIQELIELQKARIRKMYLKEKDSPFLFGTLYKEMEVLLRAYKQSTDLKMELGQLKRVPEQIQMQAVIGSPGERSFIGGVTVRDEVIQATNRAIKMLIGTGRLEVGELSN